MNPPLTPYENYLTASEILRKVKSRGAIMSPLEYQSHVAVAQVHAILAIANVAYSHGRDEAP